MWVLISIILTLLNTVQSRPEPINYIGNNHQNEMRLDHSKDFNSNGREKLFGEEYSYDDLGMYLFLLL